jgi:hypothetical protein
MREIPFVRIRTKRAHRDGITLDPNAIAFDEQFRILRRDLPIRRDGERVIARPDHVLPRGDIRLRDGEAVDIFPLVISLEHRLPVEPDVARPADEIDADFLHLHPAFRRDRVVDGLLALEFVERDIRTIAGDEFEADGNGLRDSSEEN